MQSAAKVTLLAAATSLATLTSPAAEPLRMAAASPAPAITERMDIEPLQTGLTSIDLAYEIYGGGMHVVSFGTQAVFTPRTYEIASQLQTEGMADSLFNGRMNSSARGMLTESGPRLQTYAQDYEGRFGERSIFMSLTGDGNYSVMAEPADGVHSHGFNPRTVQGTVDPLTASIYTAINSPDAPCDQTIPVFDGRRIFHLEFSFLDETELTREGVGIYDGVALKCAVQFKPIAGYTREWQLRFAQDPMKPFTIWLVRFDNIMGEDGSKPLILPVRLLVETSIVNATAHLTNAIIDGRELVDVPSN